MAGREIEAILKIKDELSGHVQRANKSLKDLNKEVGKVHRATERVGKNTGFFNLAKSIIGAQVAMVGFRGVINVVRESIDAISQQEQAINSLNLALANQGNLLPGTSQRLQEYASGLQRVTTFGDEVILQGQSLLASFGMNEEQLKQTTAVALDFAAATGRDLTMAVNLLGKAFVGETGELSRYGIVIDKNIPKNERFAEVMRQLNERFGGQAQAAAATMAGRLEQIGNAAGDAKEGLGKFIGELINFGGSTQTTIGIFDRLNRFFGQDLVIALGEARAMFSELLAGVYEFFAGFFNAASELPVVGKHFAALSADFSNVAEGARIAAAQFREESMAAALAAGKTLEFSNAAGPSGAAGAAGSLATTIETKVNPAFKKYYASLLDTTPQVQGLTIATISADSVLNKYGSTLLHVTPGVTGVTDAANEAATATVSWADVTGNLTGAMGDAGNILSVFGVEVDSTIGKITRLISSFESLFDNISGIIGLFTGGGLGGGGGLGSLLGGLFGGGGGGIPGIGASGLLSAGTPGTLGALGGGGAAGAGGGGLSGMLAGFFTNPLTAIIGGGIGVGFLLTKLFGGPSTFEKVGEEASSLFGMSFSEGLQWHIVNQAEDLFGGNIGAAMSANLGEIIREGLADGIQPGELDMLTEKVGDVFSYFERGEISAEQAQQALNASMAQLLPILDQLGPAGQAQLERIVAAAERLGIEFEGLDVLADNLGGSIGDIPEPSGGGGGGGSGGGGGGGQGAKAVNITSSPQIAIHLTQPLGTPEQIRDAIAGPVKQMIEDNESDITGKILRELRTQGGIG